MSKNKMYLFGAGNNKGLIDFEKIKPLQDRRLKIDELIASRVTHESLEYGDSLIDDINKKLTQKINKHIYDLAESKGVSLWDICLNYIPEFVDEKFVAEGSKTTYNQTVRLVPLPIDFEQKPAAWSEKDEEISEAIIKRIKGESEALSVSLSSAISWVGNIKDRVQLQPQWKPSEEQMKALCKFIDTGNTNATVLESLYNDLKKL